MSDQLDQLDADVVEVPDDPFVFLAFAAEEYAAADRSFWRIKGLHDKLEPAERTKAHEAHLDVLRRRRRDAYSNLSAWFATCEARRLAIEAARA